MINIVIDKAKKLSGIYNIFLKFSYYNQKLIDIARSFSERKYDEKTKTWEIPLYKLKDVVRLYRTELIHIYFKKDKEKEVVEIPRDFNFITKPFPHQIEGIRYLINKENCLLGDEQGLGKTFQSLVAAKIRMDMNQVNKCLILCGVNSLKFNWLKEVKMHLGEDATILGLRKRKRKNVYYMGSTEDKLEDLDNTDKRFIITNVETLIVEKFVKKLIKREDINMIILDECHKCTINTTSQRGKALQKLAIKPYKIALSGTPILNTPVDAYGVLKWLGYEKSNKEDFEWFYCVYEEYNNIQMVRYKNLHVLKQIFNTCMLRRLKEEVLDLPPKIYSTEFLEMGDKQRKIYEELQTEMLKNIDMIAECKNPLSKLIRLRQATNYTGTLSSNIHESVKIERIKDIIKENVLNNKKCIIFSNWTSMTDELEKALSDYNYAIMTGDYSDVHNEEEKVRFQNDPECKVLIGTIGTMGTGHTLTAASTVIFTDLPWNKGTMDQCTDRVHRIGLKGTVNIITLICKDTIDERINDIVYIKGLMAEEILNNGTVKSKKELLFELFN